MKAGLILNTAFVHFVFLSQASYLRDRDSMWRRAMDSTSDHYIDGNNGCCSRQPKFVTVRLADYLGTGAKLDVGHCRKSCNKPRPTADETVEYSTIKECRSICTVSRSRFQRLSTLYGMKDIAVIEACECRPRTRCSRETSSVILYPGSPYQTHLDVGVCSGHCAPGGCKPIRNRTRSVPGPNGSYCHSVIEECGCVSSCYRMSVFETVYDYSDAGGQNSSEPTIQEIDIGRCVGACDSSRRCVYRDKMDPGKCLAGLYTRRRSTCSPSQVHVHHYVTLHRITREIIAVKSCSCA